MDMNLPANRAGGGARGLANKDQGGWELGSLHGFWMDKGISEAGLVQAKA
jgi:hypothetical protein